MPAHIYDVIRDFGLLYDHVPLYTERRDVAFYVSEATAANGAVLELGCGTGRILLPIARAVASGVSGIDSSAVMLERCRAKLAQEPEAVRRRVTVAQHDMRDFDLGARFQLIIAPFRVVQHLITIDDQLRFLTAAARHLAPGGRLVFDVFNPNFSLMVGADGVERDDTPEQQLPDGRAFRRAWRIPRVRWRDQVNETELIYYVRARPGAEAQRSVQAFEMRWFLPIELEHLLARAGLARRHLYGDFTRAPLADSSPELIVVAERR